MHEADEPDVVSDFTHPDGLSGKDLTEIDLASTEAQSAALSHGDGHVVEGVVQLRQADVGPG